MRELEELMKVSTITGNRENICWSISADNTRPVRTHNGNTKVFFPDQNIEDLGNCLTYVDIIIAISNMGILLMFLYELLNKEFMASLIAILMSADVR